MESLSRFAKEKIQSTTIDIKGGHSNDILDTIAELGLLGMNIPEEHGEAGFSSFAYSRIFEKICRIGRKRYQDTGCTLEG